MKIGCVIPTRGDRPEFLKHAMYLLKSQTVQPDEIEIVNYTPKSQNKDISERYKYGVNELKKRGCEIVFFWEEDDWYSKIYISAMLAVWKMNKQPDLFGIGSTVYYHLKTLMYFKMQHNQHSSAFCTLMKTDLNLDFINDNEVFFDIKLWKQHKGTLVDFKEYICLGIKHGIGMSGGKGHDSALKSYTIDDSKMKILKEIIDKKSFLFYKRLHTKINEVSNNNNHI